MEEKLGIYKNIQYSGEKTKDNHKLYYATCSVCGKTVKRRYSDIKRYSDRCTHTQGEKNTYKFPKINDIKGIGHSRKKSKADSLKVGCAVSVVKQQYSAHAKDCAYNFNRANLILKKNYAS